MPLEPDLSVVVPVHNERDNVASLLREIAAALTPLGLNWEALFVDDHSRDDTLNVLRALRAEQPRLRVLHHVRQSGQSTAVRTGVKAARGRWIATLDGDGQNDPADIPKLLAILPSSCMPVGASTARTAAASAGPRRSPMPSVRACCATRRPTPAAD